MREYHLENLSHDPIHGYIPFTSCEGTAQGEVAERDLIDHPWVQRLRFIHQLQTAWWVYPTAEHTRFQHVIGVMHLASRATAALYDSLREQCPDCPSRPYVESLLRIAGLLHDVGHGPFGHFFDAKFLSTYRVTHETLGARIITDRLGDLIRRIRRNPNGRLAEGETLDPEQIAWLIQRPSGKEDEASRPTWLRFLRSLLSGVYTIDNMDFVLRDAYMTGYSQRSFDLDRLLHYSFFTPSGLTIHDRGFGALLRFMTMRSELFQSVYYHRSVRGIDLSLADLFDEGKQYLFPGNPLDHLDEYLEFTEASLLVDVVRWRTAADPHQRALGERWTDLIRYRRVPWVMVCQRTLVFSEHDSETASIFSAPDYIEQKLREHLPPDARSAPLRVDIARHIHRPHTHGPAAGQNFLYDAGRGQVRELSASLLYRQLPVSHRICRVYANNGEHQAALAAALDRLIGGHSEDDVTNM
ncbi:HD domain-containing protein [Lignipirellula cremea]|uniref:HD domain protein n=1 Tax=Lignipirellula cremea TaxID=2528010 RepID=A0A518E229_9BACT|nr:HD domain-containing protein [Lignipirellula cremea]QDU98131.1 HD domain protein [Lignipirellula cremea]